MLGEFKVSRCTRRCFKLDRSLREGEVYYSVVIERDESLERRDYSAESWTGPPEDAVGWWKNRMPTADQKTLVLAPPEVLVDLVRQMSGQEGGRKQAYLLALMLLRRKLVRESHAELFHRAPSSEVEKPKGDVKELKLEVIADGSALNVPVVAIDRCEVESLTEELNTLLYCEADPLAAPDEQAPANDG